MKKVDEIVADIKERIRYHETELHKLRNALSALVVESMPKSRAKTFESIIYDILEDTVMYSKELYEIYLKTTGREMSKKDFTANLATSLRKGRIKVEFLKGNPIDERYRYFRK